PSQTIIGTASLGRRRMVWHGQEVRAGVLVDLAVLPEHRSLGPALILQQGLMEAASRDMGLLYGFPNRKATAVFRRIGYEQLTEIVRYVRVVRHAPYLQRRIPTWLAQPLGLAVDLACWLREAFRGSTGPRLHGHWSSKADARMDALWSKSEKGRGLVAIRDSQHAHWRFDASPLASTRYFFLTLPGSDALVAWFATQTEGETVHISDFWSIDGVNGMARPCLVALLAAARSAGHASVSVEIAAMPSHVLEWQKNGFTERSRRPVFGRWNIAQAAGTSAELFLTSADEDE
ncbi:MAG: GNAT family N-acetyltransferase, partial [Dokdonella sp.]